MLSILTSWDSMSITASSLPMTLMLRPLCPLLSSSSFSASPSSRTDGKGAKDCGREAEVTSTRFENIYGAMEHSKSIGRVSIFSSNWCLMWDKRLCMFHIILILTFTCSGTFLFRRPGGVKGVKRYSIVYHITGEQPDHYVQHVPKTNSS